MKFSEFAQKLASIISAGSSTDVFTKSIFEAVVSEEGQDILEGYTRSSYKGFYNGHTSIRKISSKLNAYLESMEFSDYISKFSDGVVENLCREFKEEIPDIDLYNAGEKLADLFVTIITEAAGSKKKSAPKDTVKMGTYSDIAPEITPENAGKIFIVDPQIAEALVSLEEDVEPFKKYLNSAVTFYSTKKTLLYAEKPHPFYDLYVCNDIRYRKFRTIGVRDTKEEKTISNVTVPKLEAEAKYVIIEGTGGIGKSMLLTHLFLSSAKETKNGEIPLLLSLKDYKDTTSSIVDFIWKSIKEFDSGITQKKRDKCTAGKQADSAYGWSR